MIAITSSHQVYERSVRSVMLLLNTRISLGMDSGARRTAQSIVTDARNNLNTRAKFSSGRLANAIMVKNANPGFKTAFRWDVVIDTARAPYADWVEAGANAVELPYSQTGKKDFSKSKFKGHNYMSDSFKAHEEGKAETIVNEEITKALVTGK